ncbi:MAG: hypothetical protein ACRYFX_11285 [Janthinobacterium lividum]
MRFSLRCFWLAAPALLAACTTSERTSESAAPRSVPTEVVTDADRRAIYNSNSRTQSTTTGQPTPDATPNTQRLGEQASDINRMKRTETLNTNDNNTTTPETRVQRQDAAIPDSLQRP